MARICIVYGTGEGQTTKVTERIVAALEDRGHDVTWTELATGAGGIDLEACDAVLVGSSIHMGKHARRIRRFVKRHAESLSARPAAFYQVSLSSATEDGAEQAAEYVEELVEASGWQPDVVGLFGGALRFSQYGFLKRFIMRSIVAKTMDDVDGSEDVEFTEWEEVDAFAADVADLVEAAGKRPAGEVAERV